MHLYFIIINYENIILLIWIVYYLIRLLFTYWHYGKTVKVFSLVNNIFVQIYLFKLKLTMYFLRYKYIYCLKIFAVFVIITLD